MSLTHFSTAVVKVYVSAEALDGPNAFLAAITMLNMLGRFVGIVELHVIGKVKSPVHEALDRSLSFLRRIDTREGRSVLLVLEDGVDVSSSVPPAARVWIGRAQDLVSRVSADPMTDVHVSFDGWTCILRRGASPSEIVASAVPFGALAAACFAVAEVFKTLGAASVSKDNLPMFVRRFTHDWCFSVWTMNRVADGAHYVPPRGIDPLPPLVVDRILQVGAGAVGNATILALRSVAAISGILRVFDAKRVGMKTLNRCYFFTEDDVDAHKVRVVERTGSRPGLDVQGYADEFSSAVAKDIPILLSTVDNNEVRHRMQEVLPEVLVEGATGGTKIAVGVHTPGNGRSCLVCRHPDPATGLTRLVPLSLQDAATITGLTEAEIASGRVDNTMAVTDEIIARVSVRSSAAAEVLRRARDAGQDLCGAIGNLRARLGTIVGPLEASVPFVSNLAGILAAAEVVKLLLRAAGIADVPVLDNVIEMDLARDYSRHASLAYAEPPRSDCALCQERADIIANLAVQKAAQEPRV